MLLFKKCSIGWHLTWKRVFTSLIQNRNIQKLDGFRFLKSWLILAIIRTEKNILNKNIDSQVLALAIQYFRRGDWNMLNENIHKNRWSRSKDLRPLNKNWARTPPPIPLMARIRWSQKVVKGLVGLYHYDNVLRVKKTYFLKWH